MVQTWLGDHDLGEMLAEFIGTATEARPRHTALHHRTLHFTVAAVIGWSN